MLLEKAKKKFPFRKDDVVLAKYGSDLYYAKILSINYKRKLAKLLFDDDSKEDVNFRKIFSVNEETSDIICIICKTDKTETENDIVLCDRCNVGYHQMCHDPQIMSEVLTPEVPWECIYCQKKMNNPYVSENPFESKQEFEEDAEMTVVNDDKMMTPEVMIEDINKTIIHKNTNNSTSSSNAINGGDHHNTIGEAARTNKSENNNNNNKNNSINVECDIEKLKLCDDGYDGVPEIATANTTTTDLNNNSNINNNNNQIDTTGETHQGSGHEVVIAHADSTSNEDFIDVVNECEEDTSALFLRSNSQALKVEPKTEEKMDSQQCKHSGIYSSGLLTTTTAIFSKPCDNFHRRSPNSPAVEDVFHDDAHPPLSFSIKTERRHSSSSGYASPDSSNFSFSEGGRNSSSSGVVSISKGQLLDNALPLNKARRHYPDSYYVSSSSTKTALVHPYDVFRYDASRMMLDSPPFDGSRSRSRYSSESLSPSLFQKHEDIHYHHGNHHHHHQQQQQQLHQRQPRTFPYNSTNAKRTDLRRHSVEILEELREEREMPAYMRVPSEKTEIRFPSPSSRSRTHSSTNHGMRLPSYTDDTETQYFRSRYEQKHSPQQRRLSENNSLPPSPVSRDHFPYVHNADQTTRFFIPSPVHRVQLASASSSPVQIPDPNSRVFHFKSDERDFSKSKTSQIYRPEIRHHDWLPRTPEETDLEKNFPKDDEKPTFQRKRITSDCSGLNFDRKRILSDPIEDSHHHQKEAKRILKRTISAPCDRHFTKRSKIMGGGPNVVVTALGHQHPREGRIQSNSPRVQQATTKRHQVCYKCNSPAELLCSACEQAWYCSPQCQLSDWEIHLKICKNRSISKCH